MIDRKYSALFSPLRVGSVTLRNRIESAPTSLAELSPEGYLTRENIAYYRLKAKGGAAVVTVGESIVHSPTGKSHPKHDPAGRSRGHALARRDARTPSISMGRSRRSSCRTAAWSANPAFLNGRRPIGPIAASVDIGFRERPRPSGWRWKR